MKNRILSLQSKLEKYPFGNRILSYLIARSAPYFLTISPRIIILKANYIEVSMRKKRSVENHLKTVHAIAMCNLCEFAAGICIETSIPHDKRWIPMGMDISYNHKAKTNLRAICDLSFVNWDETNKVECPVTVFDNNNTEVVKATITMKVSSKK